MYLRGTSSHLCHGVSETLARSLLVRCACVNSLVGGLYFLVMFVELIWMIMPLSPKRWISSAHAPAGRPFNSFFLLVSYVIWNLTFLHLIGRSSLQDDSLKLVGSHTFDFWGSWSVLKMPRRCEASVILDDRKWWSQWNSTGPGVGHMWTQRLALAPASWRPDFGNHHHLDDFRN